MKCFFFAGAIATAFFASSPVLAQEAPRAGGFNIGAHIGYDQVSLGDGTSSGSRSDLMYAVTAGYDVPVGSGFVGFEGEFADSQVGLSETDILTPGDRLTFSAGRDLYLGIRAGMTAGPFKIYAKGGYTRARLKAAYDDGTTVLSDSQSVDGFRVGAGTDIVINSHISARLEYRYSDYGDVLNTGVKMSRSQFITGLLGRF
jgi:outer membrane immunogenic protein